MNFLIEVRPVTGKSAYIDFHVQFGCINEMRNTDTDLLLISKKVIATSVKNSKVNPIFTRRR